MRRPLPQQGDDNPTLKLLWINHQPPPFNASASLLIGRNHKDSAKANMILNEYADYPLSISQTICTPEKEISEQKCSDAL